MNSFEVLQQYIRYTLDSQKNYLFICRSRGGLAKTSSVLDVLKERKLEADKDFLYLSGMVTPLELFQSLQNFSTKLIVLDDLEGVVGEKKNLALLKAVTFPTIHDQRIAQWHSSKRSTEKSIFICNSKFIMLCNSTPKNPDWTAIQSRGIYYYMKPTNDEVFEQILLRKGADVEVVELPPQTLEGISGSQE